MNSTQEATTAILDFLAQSKPDATFHPSLFTMTGLRSGTPHAIRKLKAVGVIEIAGLNINRQPLYRRGPAYGAQNECK